MNAPNDDLSKWKGYWKDKDSPLHRHNDDFFYKLYADEINLILRRFGYQQGPVLESGCGNGALYPHLNIDKQNYIGMDISSSLLDQFRKAHPGVKLLEESAENIPTGPYALIFSNGLGQYFNESRMKAYIETATEQLLPGGLLIIANLLSKEARSRFFAGVYADQACLPTRRRNLRQWLRSLVQVVRPQPDDPMGHWINPEDVLKFTTTQLNTILGSIFHPYRFTLVSQKPTK